MDAMFVGPLSLRLHAVFSPKETSSCHRYQQRLHLALVARLDQSKGSLNAKVK
jgi:hypothetical protein